MSLRGVFWFCAFEILEVDSFKIGYNVIGPTIPAIQLPNSNWWRRIDDDR